MAAKVSLVELEKQVINLLLSLYWGRQWNELSIKTQMDESTRDMPVTPYLGAYGVAGYVLTLEGSPPHGTILTVNTKCDEPFRDFSYTPFVYADNGGKHRSLTKKQMKIVHDYLHALYLKNKESKG